MNILLPIETMVRELDYRLFLAGYFARRDRRIFVGHSPAIDRVATNTKGGIYVGKHNFYRRKDGTLIYADAKKSGYVVVHHAEEGAVFPGREDAWDAELLRAVDPSELAPEDRICTWGDYQTGFYQRSSPACLPENILTVGHPRFDLCSPKYFDIYADDVAKIRAKHGEFVLINSNFSIANTPVGMRSTFSAYMGYEPTNPALRERYVSTWARVARALASFVELVHKLSIRRPDIQFVLRPHPSDDVEYFHGVFNSVPNISVVREGPVGPWILASRLLIHDGSTSGLEGHLLGRPVVNYVPEVHDPETNLYLPNIVGTTSSSEAHAIETVLGILERRQEGATPIDIPARARALFSNFEKESFPALLQTMEQAEGDVRSSRAETARIRAAEAGAAAVERAKRMVRPLSRRRQRAAGEIRALFDRFDRDAVRQKLEIVRRITGNPIEVTFHSPKLLEISSPRRT